MEAITSAGRHAVGPGEVRVLHPLRLAAGSTGEGVGPGVHVGVAVDVETTGLDHRTGRIIELALRRFRYDADRVITDIDVAYEWRQDPGEPLTAEISLLTGLSDADLVDREIDVGAATRILNSASFVVAHNSAFDRVWVEERLPGAAGLPWACSMANVDWRAQGFDGRSLGFLLMQAGFYFCGHRASADVDALIQLLRHRFEDGRTALCHLIENAAAPTWLFRARGAHFDLKDRLRERGYRWAPHPAKVWWREVADDRRLEEEWWLASHVYGDGTATALGPDIRKVTCRERFLPLRDLKPSPEGEISKQGA